MEKYAETKKDDIKAFKPWHIDVMRSIEHKRVSFETKEFENCSENLKDLILSCLKKNPYKRKSVPDILNHNFFKMSSNICKMNIYPFA